MIDVDRKSLLVHVDAKTTLGDLEAALAKEGLTLRVARPMLAAHERRPIGAWLSDGAPGAPDPWLDPCDHLVAGLTATLADGRTMEVRPAPRRAVGPDLAALVLGMNGRFGALESAWVRVHLSDMPRRETDPVTFDRDPPLEHGEETILARIKASLSRG